MKTLNNIDSTNKVIYTLPKIEIVNFDYNDIITTSNECTGTDTCRGNYSSNQNDPLV